ncbi:MAG: DNA mismatch repair protein MutS, partial [Verrucomicrobiota bacterium]|nr:DNA mismatch repair protein MutS [Verrucomicrobiota bacterium]
MVAQNKSSKKSLTPMMRQYMDKKRELSGDTILLFRMGDFYELFFEDAQKGSKLMNIALTKRSGVPMCGIPYHAKDIYVPRILNAGQKVAIAEQMEDPKVAKGIVKRDIIQVITPGTILDESVLQSGISNFIVAICELRNTFGIASLDISTGEFKVTQLADKDELYTELY